MFVGSGWSDEGRLGVVGECCGSCGSCLGDDLVLHFDGVDLVIEESAFKH